MHYLVTGGAGFIGSNLVDALLQDGHSVVVIDDFSSGNYANLEHHKTNSKLMVYKKSICADVGTIFKSHRFDTVFHLAAKPGVQYSIHYPLEAHYTNVDGTVYLLEMCRVHKVKRFVFSSSSSVYGDQDSLPVHEGMIPNPLSPYALHKLTGEYYCGLYHSLYGIETISLRYFNVYGKRQNPKSDYAALIPKFISLIKNNTQPTINGDGEQTRDFTYVDDVVAANIAAANVQNKEVYGNAFNVGGGKNISVNEVTKQLLTLAGSALTPIHGPAVVEARDSLADISRARVLLNWKPTVHFNEGIRKTFEFFV